MLDYFEMFLEVPVFQENSLKKSNSMKINTFAYGPLQYGQNSRNPHAICVKENSYSLVSINVTISN